MKEIKACICEGGAERIIIDKLLDNDKLIFNRDELLDNEVLKCRSAKQFENRYLGKKFNSPIIVYRILDSHRENFTLSKMYKDKVEVINVVTAPEIEMLIIINENKYNEYNKLKSKIKPSEFCKNNLKFHNVKSRDFVDKYFSDIDKLVRCINEYKRISNIRNNELCLADLLK